MTPRSALPVSLLAAFAGLAHAWSVATPWNGQSAWWLQLAALGLLPHCLDGTVSIRRAFWLGWLFGTSWLCASFWWLYTSMHVYGGLPPALAAAAVFLLAGALSIYLALACAAYAAWVPAGPLKRAALFGCLWLLAELARGIWFTGLPWGAGGYAHVDGPLSVLVPWFGVYGVGAIAAFSAALLAAGLKHAGLWISVADRSGKVRRRWIDPGVAAGLMVLALLLTTLHWVDLSFTRPAGRFGVTLLQGNIAQDEKFQPGSGIPQALRWYGEQLRAADRDLVIAPETAIPLLVRQLPPGYWEDISQRFSQGGQAALIGMPAGSAAQGYSNAVVGLKPGQTAPYQYDKHHLVPFGEFIPPLFRWFTRMMAIPLGDFKRGGLGQAPFVWKGQRIAPNVCYEDLFGEELATRFTDAALAPTAFANLSNIAWFGEGIAIDQHLGISRMRALEFERPFVRATNTGTTAIIDHRGIVTHALPRATRGVLRGEVEGRDGVTPYAAWVGWLGLWPYWLISTGAVLAGAMLCRCNRRRHQNAMGHNLKSKACAPP
jgi:apolipoprotein N-acyltransferase